MTASGRCPACGGELRTAERQGVTFRQCLACGSAVLDRASINALLPPATPPGPAQSDYDYPVHYPQDDRGHAAARPQPPFAPPWASDTAADPGGLGLMFGR